LRTWVLETNRKVRPPRRDPLEGKEMRNRKNVGPKNKRKRENVETVLSKTAGNIFLTSNL